MSKTNTIESVNWHVHNGGLSFSVVERQDFRKDCYALPDDWHNHHPDRTEAQREAILAALPRETRCQYSWRFVVKMTNHGSGPEFSFPLVPVMVGWIIDMGQRLLVRMESPKAMPSDGYEHAFRNLDHGDVSHKDGQRVTQYFGKAPEPRVTFSNPKSK